MRTALSSGCFIGHESRIADAGIDAVELSSHAPDRLTTVLQALASAGTRVLSIHTPCPNRGRGLDPGASAEQWPWTEQGLFEAGEIAVSVNARYVLAHAFFCGATDLPANDFERMLALRGETGALAPMHAYVRSSAYLEAKERTIRNLQSILPEWKRRFPRQKLILENLNPRHGYGGIVFQDVVDVVSAFDGEIGICLDIGHLALSEAALGIDMAGSVAAARDLIWSVHVHQNFGGRYCIDRHWMDSEPRPGLQDVDCHLPLHASLWTSPDSVEFAAGRENAAFENSLLGPATYMRGDGAVQVRGVVDVDRWLAMVSPDAHLVLELDARYVPLHDVLEDYDRFKARYRTGVKEAVA